MILYYLFAVVLLSLHTVNNMEDWSVVGTGFSTEDSYKDIDSYFRSAGVVEEVVRVMAAGMKFSGKAYAVYTDKESATSAALTLSKDDIKVQAIGAENQEFQALVGPQMKTSEEVRFMQQWKQFDTSQQTMLMKMIDPRTAATGAIGGALGSPGTPASFFGDSPVVIHDKPSVPNFSGTGKDCSFGRWKHEVKCLAADPKYSARTILEVVRKSLKTPAADILPRLGVSPTLDQVIKKIESTYGSVLPGEDILQKFYSEMQDQDESCAKWSMRLEDLAYQATEKKSMPLESLPTTLTKRFWGGLRDPIIKNALRNRYTDLGFEETLTEARLIEEENKTTQKEKVKSQQVTGQDDKLDLLLQEMKNMKMEIQQLKEDKKKSTESRKGPVVCEKCSMEGHLSWGCRKDQDVECYRCHTKGHTSRSCRNKKKALN